MADYIFHFAYSGVYQDCILDGEEFLIGEGEKMSQEVTPQFAIDYLLDDCEDCPEYKDGECVTESHCFEVKQMCIKALRGELKGENKMIIDEIFSVMKHFHGSYINQCGELIISERGNVYFTARNCKDKEDVICKLLEWCSRPIAKGEPYSTRKRNVEWRNSLLCGYNNYLGTNFTQEDMYWIYDKLGNAVNHELTLKFIHSGYDLSLVRPKENKE